ncbi:ATP-binding protein [Rhizobacter sp. SG703]|uniref:AAA family ATPase n=1 Tax=Rhizobacter sp. SG703 TaxID=2587140 RepID=UPI001446F867|nr:ATP-binding protein [Rhizobacter sp. SG703]NKI97168.1 putative kinase [Rhizobacter sp. SG703]
MPIVHLIHGYLGVGKTTFARRLEREIRAVRFSPDEWLTRLYGDDPPAERFDDFMTRVFDIANEQWRAVVRCGADVILDYGFWTRSWRDAARAGAAELGADVRLYALSCPEELARHRIQERNRNLRGSVFVADATYDALKSRFLPLQADELTGVVHVDTTGAAVRCPE